MRRSRYLAVGVALVLTFAAPVHAAAPKAGAKCLKKNATVISGEKVFTCIQSGKKLVWNKGVAIKKPVPIVTPTPTATAISESSPTPIITPTPTPISTPKVPISFDDLVENYQGIAYAAWSKSREKILASKKTEITLKMVLGPSTSLTNTRPMDAIDLVTRLYPGFIQPAEVYFMAFNYDDREWATNQMETLIPNSGSQWIKGTACRTKETCWGAGAFYNGTNRYLIVLTTGIINNNTTSGTLEAHEFTHIVQQMNMKKGRPPAEFIYDPWPPTWYWEGQANFAQHATIYHDSFDDYLKFRRSTSEGLFRNPVYNSSHIQDYFVFNAPADWQQKYEKGRLYDLGAMFVEVLVALKGPEASMEMWKIASSGVNFQVAFEQIYGIPYSKALPIMAKAIALELGHR